jgi:predicted ATPase
VITLINKISLKNFKAFENAEIEIKPITILVGPNNGGKTSVIQSILLIQQTLRGSGNEVLNINGPLVNLGDFKGLVNQKSKEKEMGFKFDFDDDNRTYIDFTIAMEKDTILFVKNFSCDTGVFEYFLDDMNIEKDLYRPQKFKINPNIFEKYPIVEPIFYRDTFFLKFRSIGELPDLLKKLYYKPWLKKEKHSPIFAIRSPGGVRIKFRNLFGKIIDFFKKIYHKYIGRVKTDKEIDELLRTDEEIEGFPRTDEGIEEPSRTDEGIGELSEVYRDLLKFSYDLPRISNDFYEQKIKTEFNNINYIGPIREKAHRFYEIGLFDYVGSMGEHAVQMIEADPDLEDKAQKFLRELEIADALQVSKMRSQNNFEFKLKTKIAEGVNLTALGCGTSQILPIIVQCLYSKENFEKPQKTLKYLKKEYTGEDGMSSKSKFFKVESMTIIEQPEVHLHPKAQADLAELFIKIAKDKTRFLIESHSDYFVERIRMGIMRGDITKDDVAIYYIEQNEKKRCSTVTKIEINKMGQYSNLPDGYLTNIGLKEIKDQTDLMLKKLLKETSTK